MEAEDQQDISRVPKQLQPHVFKKGQSGNPGGRPKGKSLKTYAREMIENMDDDERQEFFNGIDKIRLWEMAEGKPETQVKAKVEVNKLKDLPDEELDKLIEEGSSTEGEKGEG